MLLGEYVIKSWCWEDQPHSTSGELFSGHMVPQNKYWSRHLCRSGFFCRETKPKECMYVCVGRAGVYIVRGVLIWRNWLRDCKAGASEPKGQGGRLKSQARVVVLSPKSLGQTSRPESQAGFLHWSLESELLLWETSGSALTAMEWFDELHPHYRGQSPLHKVNWSIVAVNHVYKMPSWQCLHSYLTVAQPYWWVKLNLHAGLVSCPISQPLTHTSSSVARFFTFLRKSWNSRFSREISQ